MAKCGNCIAGQHDKCTGWVKPFEKCDCKHDATSFKPKPEVRGTVYY